MARVMSEMYEMMMMYDSIVFLIRFRKADFRRQFRFMSRYNFIVSLLHITRSSRMNACNEIIWIAIPPSAAVSNTALWELGYRRR